MKIEISFKDLIIFCLIAALFLFVFTQFAKYEKALDLAKRQGQIDQNSKNVMTLDQAIGNHEERIQKLESGESGPRGK